MGAVTLERRGRLRAQSKKARQRARAQAKVRHEVFERDGYRCQLAEVHDVEVHGELVAVPPCFGHPTPHHIEKRSQRHLDTEGNETTLCSGHNDWLEACPRAVAVALGLALPAKHDVSAVVELDL